MTVSMQELSRFYSFCNNFYTAFDSFKADISFLNFVCFSYFKTVPTSFWLRILFFSTFFIVLFQCYFIVVDSFYTIETFRADVFEFMNVCTFLTHSWWNCEILFNSYYYVFGKFDLLLSGCNEIVFWFLTYFWQYCLIVYYGLY